MKNAFAQKGFALLSLVMVVATVTLVGFVAFRFLDAQDNTQIADDSSHTTTQVAAVNNADDVETVSKQLDSAELDSLDADLDKEFSF